jgi:hypothetical protein
VAGEQRDAVRVLGVVAEVAIGLVEDDERRIGGEQRMIALVCAVTRRATSSRSVS